MFLVWTRDFLRAVLAFVEIFEQIANAIVIFWWLVCANINFCGIVRHPFVITQTVRTASREFVKRILDVVGLFVHGEKCVKDASGCIPAWTPPSYCLPTSSLATTWHCLRQPRCVHSVLGYCGGSLYSMLLQNLCIMACHALCRITTSPRIEGQLPHCCCICEKGSGSHNTTGWKWEISKVQASIGRYVVSQHAGTLGGIRKSKNVSIKGKEWSEYAPHSRTSNPMPSAPTRTANKQASCQAE